MKTFIQSLLGWLTLILIFAGIIIYPAAKNYLIGDSVVINYSWIGPNEVEISTNFDSAIPNGYSLYVYTQEPTSRTENSVSTDFGGWKYVTFTTGWNGKIRLPVNHTQVIQTICVRTGTDPEANIKDKMIFSFDTSDTMNFGIQTDCE